MDRIKFAIDPSGLQDDRPSTAQEVEFLRLRVDLLLEFWKSFGTLVDPDPVYSKLFDGTLAWDRDSLQTMKAALRPFMTGGGGSMDLVHQLEDEEGPLSILWEGVDNPQAMAQWLPDFELAMVGQRIADSVGLTDGNDCKDIPPDPHYSDRFMDVIRWSNSISRSCKVHNRDELTRRRAVEFEDSMRPIEEGQDVDLVWRERFQRYVQPAREIVLIDYYAAKASLLDLLRRINNDTSGCRVTVYTMYEYKSRTEALACVSFEECLKAFKNLRGITIYILPSEFFSNNDARNRYIRFDDHARVMMHGIGDMFGLRKVKSSGPFTVIDVAKVRKTEKYLCGRTKNTKAVDKYIIKVPEEKSHPLS